MSLTEMYPAKNNSPSTTLTEDLNSNADSMIVEDVSVFPEAPNIAVIGNSNDAEIIRYSEINGNTLTITRGLNGTTRSTWPAGTSVARNFTSYDHDAFIENILDLENRKLEAMDTVPTAGSTKPVQSNGIAAAISQVTTIANGKVAKSGDTMIGDLTIKTILDPALSSTTNFDRPVILKDKNASEIGRLQIAQDDNVYTDTRRLSLFTYRDVNGETINNGFQIGVDANGKRRYKVSDEKQFCYDVLTHEILYFTNKATSATTSEAVFCTITDDKITANHVVTNLEFTDSNSVLIPVTWSTYDGYMTLTGINSSASNTVSVTLGFAGNL